MTPRARSRGRSFLRPYASGLAVGVVVAVLAGIGLLEPLEYWSLDRFFEIRGQSRPRVRIVIVAIDEASFAELHAPWPFPRAMHGQLLRKLADAPPLAVGVDVIFDAPSSHGPADDAALGESLTRARLVVLGAAPWTEVEERLAGAFGVAREVANLPIPELRQGAAAVAAVNLHADRDGVVRRVPVRVTVVGEPMLGLDARLHQIAAAAGWPAARLPSRDVLINFRGGPRTFPWVSYYRVLRGDVPLETFRGAIVLVGPTSAVLHDVFRTPFARGGDMPGVEIHANALETLLRGDWVRELPRWLSVPLALLAALLGAALVVRLHAVRALLFAGGLCCVVIAAVFTSFALGHVWMRGVVDALALVLGYGATVVDHFVREQREKRRLSQFFSPEVLRAVVRQRDERSLGSSRRLVTVLFSDIRGFTSISEKLEPEHVAAMLREYLSEMTEVVFRHTGTVDKYIGDCVMALYNVPFGDEDHATHAVRTALELQERTLAFAARWQAALGVALRNGVGINTGEAIVGTMGSRQRLEYTAIGDTVNLASRLEALTKDYKASIIISERTYGYVQGAFVTRELGDVVVRGKSERVKIYAVLPSDLRKHPRAILEAGATIVLKGAGALARVTTLDIGEGGLAVTGLPEAWPVGGDVEVRCEGDWLPKPIVAEGTITWRRGGHVGIAFRLHDPEVAPALAHRPTRAG